jgi:hypothetical protein
VQNVGALPSAVADPKEAVAAAKAAFNLPTMQRLRDLAIPAAPGGPSATESGAAVTDPQAIGTAAVVADHLAADVGGGSPAVKQRLTGATPSAEAAAKEAVAKADGAEMVIHFSVRDTGIGISKEDLGLLFQSFSQVQHAIHFFLTLDFLFVKICRTLQYQWAGWYTAVLLFADSK